MPLMKTPEHQKVIEIITTVFACIKDETQPSVTYLKTVINGHTIIISVEDITRGTL